MEGIKLRNQNSDKVETFEKKHAENLLQYQAEKGYSHWTLVGDKLKYENGRISRTENTGASKESKK